jgi:hypothetical protein
MRAVILALQAILLKTDPKEYYSRQIQVVTWAKRGFTSSTGVVFVKSIDTGKFWTIMFFPKFARNVP